MVNKIGEYDSKTYGWAKEEVIILIKPYLDLIGEVKGKEILDVGCGTGWLTKIIAKDAKRVVGIDKLEGMINEAKEKNPEKNIEYKKLDSSKMTSELGRFDIIISSLAIHSIESLPELEKTIKYCQSLLKEKGHAVFLVPHPCFCDRNKRSYNTYRFLKKFNYFKKGQKYKVILKSSRGVNEFISPFYNLQEYFSIFKKAGLGVTDLIEPSVNARAQKKYKSKWTSELEIPHYLIFRLEKSTPLSKLS